jgi:peptidoglycan/xylan/chitin deacetylase (PgdA/CDA1 family)
VAFVTAGLVGAPGSPGGDHDEPFLSWSQLAELHRAGVSIGSHAFDHKSLARMSPEDAAAQALRSRERIEQKLGVAVPSFAYPFGMRADFDARTDRLLSEAGYAIAFHALHGAIAAGDAPISLPRVKIEGGESLRMFRWSCDGAMDAWRVVDDALGRLRTQRTETSASADR